MTARTYTAAEMRSAYLEGYDDGHRFPDARQPAKNYARSKWPDPAPEPPAMTVREEPDPRNSGIFWRWCRGIGLQVYGGGDGWREPDPAWFYDDAHTQARLTLLADLAAFPMRLPDGRPCTLKGVARVDEQKVLAAVRRLHRGNCHGTFNGGWESPEGRRAFHHGMDTVFNLLDEALTGEAKP